MPRTERAVLYLTHYIDALLEAARTLADKIEDELDIQAVCVIVKTKEGWGGQQVAAPEGWGDREEMQLMLDAAKAAVEKAGGTMDIATVVPEDPVRSMPRRNHRRGRPRR